jgi:hypothetical protein
LPYAATAQAAKSLLASSGVRAHSEIEQPRAVLPDVVVVVAVVAFVMEEVVRDPVGCS